MVRTESILYRRLFLAVVASAAYGSPSRRLVSRWLETEETGEVDLSFIADWKCMSTGYSDKEGCNAAGCEWCPFGTIEGACVTGSQAGLINALNFPHLTCGKGEDDEEFWDDAAFWDEQMICTFTANDEKGCIGKEECTWCTVNDPAFGLCMSEEFMATLEELQPAEDPIRINQVITCNTTSRDDETPGLLDMSCYLAGKAGSEGDDQACMNAADQFGESCESIQYLATGDLCLTATQAKFLGWLIDLFDDMGIESSLVATKSGQLEGGRT